LKTTGAYTQDPAMVPLARRECRLGDAWLDDLDSVPPGAVVFYLTAGVVGGSTTDLGPGPDGLPRPNDYACP